MIYRCSLISCAIFTIGLATFTGIPALTAQEKTPAVSLAKTVTKPAGQRALGQIGTVSFNQKFIEGLRQDINVGAPVNVFAYVFSQLPKRVVVYPTENYFYWTFNNRGRAIAGNFRLDADDRDKGIIWIGYFEYDENGRFQDYDGYDKALSAKDGVIVKRESRFVYSVAYRGKTVSFQLHDIGLNPPKKAKVLKNERYVGPVFDESGIRFHLMFETRQRKFFYIVNDDDGHPGETFEKVKNMKYVLLGRRTGFAYYLDAANKRKILIAIHALNANRNNYFDGPFDQLPDNYADQTNLRRYMELAYPEVKGQINKFGQLISNKNNRVPITAYSFYSHTEDLSFVRRCKRRSKSVGKLIKCLTKEN